MRFDLAVVMTSFNARATIERSLRSLAAQQGGVDFEAVLIDSSTDGTADFVRRTFPWVRVLQFDSRKFCGDARNIGIAETTAPIIAFLDTDCEAAPDWAIRIVSAHATCDALVIGGAVANANPEVANGWAYYFTKFSSWSPGHAPRDVDDVPGCSMTLRRRAFQTFGPFLEGTYCSDSAFNWTLAKSGHRPRFDPSIRIAHINPGSLRSIVANAASHGRQFGLVRRQRQKPAAWLLTAWRLGGVVLPALLTMRTARDVFMGRCHRARFLRALPAVAIMQTAWSFGEWTSYWRPSE